MAMLTLPTWLPAVCLLLILLRADASGPGCGPYGCCQPKCRNVPTINITSEQLYNLSPLNLQVSNNAGDSSDLDSVCQTFFPFNKFTFLFIRSAYYKNGTNQIRVTIQSSIPGCPGLFREQGKENILKGCSSIVNNMYAAAEACPGVLLFYHCSLFGSGITGDTQFQYGVSSAPQTSSCCKDRIIDISTSLAPGDDGEYVLLPNRLRKKCVTRFNGAYSVGANTVPPSNSIPLPITSAPTRVG